MRSKKIVWLGMLMLLVSAYACGGGEECDDDDDEDESCSQIGGYGGGVIGRGGDDDDDDWEEDEGYTPPPRTTPTPREPTPTPDPPPAQNPPPRQDPPPGNTGSGCSSNQTWGQGTNGSPLMIPGGDCVGCHASTGGPRYTAAGTVFGNSEDPNNCYGIEGVEVEIVDSGGQRVVMRTNRAGNFFTSQRLQGPYTARVRYGGQVREMQTRTTNLNCASCHTQGGVPGRIVP